MKRLERRSIIFMLLCAGIGLIVMIVMNIAGVTGNTVVIRKEGKEVFRGSLYENREIDLETNTVVIKNGKAYVSHANCPKQICYNHAPISKKTETVVCLPNRVVVSIE